MKKDKLLVDKVDCIIISDLLYFFQNRISSVARDILVASFYSDKKYVYDEKYKLFLTTDCKDECKNRRTADKKQKNIEN